MKTIIIHHLQEMWEPGLVGEGTTFDEELLKVVLHLREQDYDRVIVTNFESFELEAEQSPLQDFYPEVHEYMYGWEREEVKSWSGYNEGVEFCEGGNHSEVVLISDWMWELVDDDVYLCGAFDGECIEDMEIALAGAGVKVNRLENLIT